MSKSNLSGSAKSSILNDIEVGLRFLKSGMGSKSNKEQPNLIKVGSLNEIIVVYGDLLVALSHLIRSQSLTAISEILRMDKIYLNGNSLEGITPYNSTFNDDKLRLKQISDQLILLEEWLEE
jgi:hypothetical protein